MNANELADKLERDGEGCTCAAYCAGECACDANWAEYHTKEAATMLRQQQAEISELKHINKNWQISENILLLELEKLQHRELTDEEITAIWYEPTLRYDPVAFARAILRKAQEK